MLDAMVESKDIIGPIPLLATSASLSVRRLLQCGWQDRDGTNARGSGNDVVLLHSDERRLRVYGIGWRRRTALRGGGALVRARGGRTLV
jgi:hypothetical protein